MSSTMHVIGVINACFKNAKDWILSIRRTISITRTHRSNYTLIILDDIFPHLLSAFRVAEYNYYFKTFSKSVVFSTASSFGIIKETRKWADVLQKYEIVYPAFKCRVFPFSRVNRFRGNLAYMVFLNNAYSFLEVIEASKLWFVFTLYPGGGFHLNQEESDRKLAKVFASPYFRKVIVTQKLSQDYVLKFLRPHQVEFIYGAVLPSNAYNEHHGKTYFPHQKQYFDICFVANQYMARGIDKGYDVFIEVSKQLLSVHNIRFHIVGSFLKEDIDVSELGNRIRFYGNQDTQFFAEFYSRMDIILSPNIPFQLAPGAFDGFPLGCSIEAAFCGVAVFCTDILNQNFAFRDGHDIVLISNKPDLISEQILHFYNNLDDLYNISINGQRKFKELFSIENQMRPRIKIIEEILASP